MWKWQLGPIRHEVIIGERLELGPCRITPIVSVISLTRRRASIRRDQIDAVGFQWARVTPLGILSERDGAKRFIPIVNVTRCIVAGLCLVGLLAFLAARIAPKGEALDAIPFVSCQSDALKASSLLK